MNWVLWVLAVPASGVFAGGLLLVAGLERRKAVWAGIATAVAAGVLLGALALTAFGECLAENPNPPPPPSWPWSPRRKFCNDGGSLAALGTSALFVVPVLAITLGGLLRWKRKAALASVAYALVLVTPFLPTLYVHALPYYRLDQYPILHQPLLRPASIGHSPRVCYVYGIVYGPRKVEVNPKTPRICVELKPTQAAIALTPGYDEGRTSYDLDWMGKKLTQRGLPIGPGETGIDGLVVTHSYTLPDRQARIGATLVK